MAVTLDALVFLFTLPQLSLTASPTIDQLIAQSMDYSSDESVMDNLAVDRIVQEMDMVFTRRQLLDLYRNRNSGRRQKRKVDQDQNLRWTKKTVPYKIADDFSQEQKDQIKKAINVWSNLTCLRFREALKGDKNYVQFENGNGCLSQIGMQSGGQIISLADNCFHPDIIMHEIGHAVGFYHEQNRPDRDYYIAVLWQNIDKNEEHNFMSYSNAIVDTDIPYDYSSIMHYGGDIYSINGRNTIDANGHQIGHQKRLSFFDVMAANMMYRCDHDCSQGKCSYPESYRGKDCKCYCKSDDNTPRECNDKDPERIWRYINPRRQWINSQIKSYYGIEKDYLPGQEEEITTAKCFDNSKACGFLLKKAGKIYCQTDSYVKENCRKSCDLCSKVDNSGHVKSGHANSGHVKSGHANNAMFIAVLVAVVEANLIK